MSNCYNSELPIGPPGPVGPQGPQGLPGNTLGYKVYTALLNQGGETAPTAIELENTLGEITFGYIDEGRYSVFSTNLFTFEKTAIFISPLNNASTEAISVVNEAGSSEFNLSTVIVSSAAFANGFLYNTAIEIRVYN